MINHTYLDITDGNLRNKRAVPVDCMLSGSCEQYEGKFILVKYCVLNLANLKDHLSDVKAIE